MSSESLPTENLAEARTTVNLSDAAPAQAIGLVDYATTGMMIHEPYQKKYENAVYVIERLADSIDFKRLFGISDIQVGYRSMKAVIASLTHDFIVTMSLQPPREDLMHAAEAHLFIARNVQYVNGPPPENAIVCRKYYLPANTPDGVGPLFATTTSTQCPGIGGWIHFVGKDRTKKSDMGRNELIEMIIGIATDRHMIGQPIAPFYWSQSNGRTMKMADNVTGGWDGMYTKQLDAIACAHTQNMSWPQNPQIGDGDVCYALQDGYQSGVAHEQTTYAGYRTMPPSNIVTTEGDALNPMAAVYIANHTPHPSTKTFFNPPSIGTQNTAALAAGVSYNQLHQQYQRPSPNSNQIFNIVHYPDGRGAYIYDSTPLEHATEEAVRAGSPNAKRKERNLRKREGKKRRTMQEGESLAVQQAADDMGTLTILPGANTETYADAVRRGAPQSERQDGSAGDEGSSGGQAATKIEAEADLTAVGTGRSGSEAVIAGTRRDENDGQDSSEHEADGKDGDAGGTSITYDGPLVIGEKAELA